MDRSRVIEKLNDVEFKIGDQPYRIVRELGRGGNGVAFLCQNAKNQKVVAKVYLPPDKRDLDEKALERFENEVSLTARLKHPNIVPSLGSGAVTMGTYRLPYYMMPQAAGTLRNEIRNDTDPVQIEKKLRMFLRAAFGVICLHAYGIVHRDLKPENILISRDGSPWVADLGIAHVNPDFVTVGLQTIESERLLNRDYYAPEQRFGKATAVDKRADIYALGCIFYEMLTSIPPVRTNAPKLSLISSAYEPFEPIWARMTAWEADARYQTLEDALEDLSVTFGWVLASLKGAAGLQHPDMSTMVKLLKTANEAQRQRGVDLAVRLGKSALQELHELAGHGKRDVRNSCARALGLIGDDSSIPILVAGLYGNSDKPTRFRPSTDTAAESLTQFSSEKRLAALRLIKNPIRQTQVQTILTGMQGNEAYEAVLDLRKRGLLLVDWSETDLQVLLAIDEDRAWPEVRALLNGDNDFKIQHILPLLNPAKRLSLLTGWIERDSNYSWYYEDQMRFVIEITTDRETRIELLEKVRSNITKHSGSFKKRDQFLSRVDKMLKEMAQAKK
jgi:tRNA A-37 threonylcarbamoyl transferase component Bud32